MAKKKKKHTEDSSEQLLFSPLEMIGEQGTGIEWRTGAGGCEGDHEAVCRPADRQRRTGRNRPGAAAHGNDGRHGVSRHHQHRQMPHDSHGDGCPLAQRREDERALHHPEHARADNRRLQVPRTLLLQLLQGVPEHDGQTRTALRGHLPEGAGTIQRV